jgi:DNA-binding transcriptional MerR regulator
MNTNVPLDLADLISRTELARACGVKTPTLRKWEASGLLPPAIHLTGRHLVYPRSDVEARLAARAARRLDQQATAVSSIEVKA